jgi:hypothetical protein
MLQKSVLSKKCVYWSPFHQKNTFGTIRDSQTPENLSPDSGVGLGVGDDIFSGVGSGSGLPQAYF